MDGELRDLAEKVYGATRARVVTRSQSEIEVLVTDLKNAINAWTKNGSSTETIGPGSQDPVGAGKGDVSQPLLIRRWCEDLADKVYGRVRARDVTYSLTERDILTVDLVNAVNTWLNAGGVTTETVGTGSPFNSNL
jgi:hypothetical protein